MNADLVKAFQSLVLPMPAVGDQQFAAISIVGAEQHRLAKDASGAPCVLLRHRAQTSRAAPIRLENLQVAFDVRCTIRDATGLVEQDTFTIVRCANRNPALFPHFLKVVSPVLASLTPVPTTTEIRRAILGLVSLFQALTAPGTKTVQGLWSELLLIRTCGDVEALARAWHADAREHFDFSDGAQRIEVKSNSYRQREHHFSLEQVTSVGGSEIIVASLFAERQGGGLTLQAMYDEIRAQIIDPVAVARFDASFFSALGSGWADAMSEAFDVQLACESLRFYEAALIPRPTNPRTDCVFDVRFRANLNSVSVAAPLDVARRGGLFRAAVPRS